MYQSGMLRSLRHSACGRDLLRYEGLVLGIGNAKGRIATEREPLEGICRVPPELPEGNAGGLL
jgi:hypothetical protein